MNEQAISAPTSENLYERACNYLALGASSSLRRNVAGQPLYFDRADGPYYFDVDGHRFLDYTLGFGPLILGANHAGLTTAVQKALSHASTFGASHPAEVDLAQRLVEILPGVDQVIFSNTGSEAVQASLRLAHSFTGRDKLVMFDGHFHGWLNNVRVRAHPEPSYHGEPRPVFQDQPTSEYADVLVISWNDISALERTFHTYRGEIAAVLMEPIPNSGSCVPKPGFLNEVVSLCRSEGALSIFDEVVTGFRLALGGARSFFNVTPDLSIYGKALGGGIPISAVGGRGEVFEPLWKGDTGHAGTYNGNPVATFAALATLDALSKEGTFDRMHSHGHAIRAYIESAGHQHRQTLVTNGAGTAFAVLFGLDEAPDNETAFRQADFRIYDWFKREMLRRGVHLLPEGRWFVGAAHSETELALVHQAIEGAMAAISDPTSTPPPPMAARKF